MFHSGGVLPEFLEYNFKQIRHWNPYTGIVQVHFLTDEHLMHNPIFDKYGITVYDKNEYYSDKITDFELLYGRNGKDFWTITTTRLIYIETFLRKHNFKSTYHFENDVMIYCDLRSMHDAFRTNYKCMAITPGGPDKVMTGFMFIRRWECLANMTQFFIDTLKQYGVKGTKEVYKMDMVNEMTLMRAYSRESSELEFLPILPFGPYSLRFDRFEAIFDPASWGQLVGGTPNEGPGVKPKDHYIGQLLIEHPEYEVVWKSEPVGTAPYVRFADTCVKLNNLHVHSKNLSKFQSI